MLSVFGARFNDRKIPWRSSVACIISSIALSVNLTNATASSSISEFALIKKFNINLHPPRAPQIIDVTWQPPIPHWIKCNTDGASSSLTASCGGIFRDSAADFLLGFAENVGNENACFAELSAMRAIELANQNNWRFLWLESDSW